MALPTTGRMTLRVADAETRFECGPGVAVTWHRSMLSPCDAAPDGVEQATVESSPGWVEVTYPEPHVCRIEMCDEPVPEPTLGDLPALMGVI